MNLHIPSPSSSSVASIVVMAVAFLAIAFAERHGSVEAIGGSRLRANFGLGVTNGLLVVALPAGTAAASFIAAQHGWGLLNLVSMPWVAGALVLLLLRSLSTYGLHRLSHTIPLLWRFHRVHHSDLHCDLSTSFRSHPLEALIGFPVAIMITGAVGAGIGQLISVETFLLTIAMWEHGHFGPMALVDRTLGLIVAMPGQHRLHHSVDPLHYNCNFGDGLILWDRLFGTYVSEAEPTTFGVENCSEGRGLSGLLLQPFRR